RSEVCSLKKAVIRSFSCQRSDGHECIVEEVGMLRDIKVDQIVLLLLPHLHADAHVRLGVTLDGSRRENPSIEIELAVFFQHNRNARSVCHRLPNLNDAILLYGMPTTLSPMEHLAWRRTQVYLANSGHRSGATLVCQAHVKGGRRREKAL